MKITNIQEYSLVASCCPCSYPTCQAPNLSCESFDANFRGTSVRNVSGTEYRTYTRKFFYFDPPTALSATSGIYTWTVRGWDMDSGPCGIKDQEPLDTTAFPPASATITNEEPISVANPFNFADYNAKIEEKMATLVWPITCIPGGDCASSKTQDAEFSHRTTYIKSRFKLGIPDGFTGSTYEVQYDLIQFPSAWEEWNDLKIAYDRYLQDKERWEDCMTDNGNDIEICGIAPEPVSDPGPPPILPTLIKTDTWVYDSDPYSDWIEIPLPTVPGNIRIVNMLITCWKSSRTGTIPTSVGEIFEI